MAALRNEVHPPGMPLAECSAAATLALAAGIPLQLFVRNHSLLPFHRSVSLKDCDVDHGNPSRMDLIELFGTRVWRQSEARFCLDCVKKDIDHLGFAYWRRSHQLPGVPWCFEHGIQLANSPIGKKAFNDMPFLEMATQYEFAEQDFLTMSANPAIQRYTDIMNTFLNSERPMAIMHARYRIAELFKRHRLRIGKRGRKPTLTDRVLEQIPRPWLQAQYPAICDQLPGEFFSPIDNITLGRVPVQGYALTLAVLFESLGEALNYWYGDIDGLPTARKVQRRFGRDYWNSRTVFNLYVEHHGSHSKIGEMLGIDPTYARIELKAAGLPALGLINMCTTGRAILDFQEGMPLKAACESNCASLDEVEKLLRGGISKLSSAIKEITQPKIRKNAKSTKGK